jgi:hypothetical protein
MEITLAGEQLAKQKLAVFEQLQPAFEASFCFVQEVHGQRRFSAFPVAQTVHYLHALWICECKDRLLSIYKNIIRYEGMKPAHNVVDTCDSYPLDENRKRALRSA